MQKKKKGSYYILTKLIPFIWFLLNSQGKYLSENVKLPFSTILALTNTNLFINKRCSNLLKKKKQNRIVVLKKMQFKRNCTF